MLKLDFISVAPHLSIFKSGANKTNLGGTLFLIYGIIFILLSAIYLNDYLTKEKYSYNYTYVKNNTKLPREAEEMSENNFDFYFYLTKDEQTGEKKNLSNNFLIMDLDRLGSISYKKQNERDPEDGFLYINTNEASKEECIIKQEFKYQRKINNFQLGVLYRCNGSNEEDCTIRDEDKIEFYSYFFHFWYRGFSFELSLIFIYIKPSSGLRSFPSRSTLPKSTIKKLFNKFSLSLL